MHDQHFLERLDRLDDPVVDEALALYYDAALVRDLLSYVAERGHGDRVAIALDDGGEGPFIIVTQRGDFVTALGRGMGVGALPVVPRAAWIAIRNKNSRHAEAWARADKLARGRVANLARAFADGGSHVSQEVMLGMHAITPMFSGALIAGYARDIRTLIDALNSIGRRDRWRQMDTAFFDTMGRVAWRAANALVLLAASHLKKRGAEDPFLALLMKHRPTGFLGELGVFGPLVRAAWATGQLGGLLLPTYKAAFRAATTPHGVVDASAGLLAIGSRFSKHRGEVRKTLTIAQRPGETHEEARRRLLGALMTLALDTAAAAPGTSRAVLCGTGRLRYQQQLSQALSKEEVEALVAELPDAVALPIATTIDISLFETDRRLRTAVAEFLAYTPQLELADLYFPQAWIDRVRRPSEAPAFERVFTAYRTAIMEIAPPARRPNTPGRNEPCPCASGRKYKRCCGA